MLMINATEARNEWSLLVDNTIREKPQFIKRTRDHMMLADVKFVQGLLSAYDFTANSFEEEDGSFTISLNEIDLIENAATEEEAKVKLSESIIDYAEDFYNEFEYWSTAPNRTSHVPYVFKALIIGDARKLGGLIRCQSGKS